MSRSRRLVRRLLALLFCAVLLEGALRLLDFDLNLEHHWRLEPVLGWTQVP